MESDTEWDYAEMFAQFLEQNVIRLAESDWQRQSNPGAPFSFGENHLREYIKESIQRGSCAVDPAWPELMVERSVGGDFVDARRRHGGVDYMFVTRDSASPHDLQNLLATFEVGGPTRPALLRGSKKNWYRKITADFRKQLWRVKNAPACAHYLALLVQPDRALDVRKDLEPVLTAMKVDVGDGELTEKSWRSLEIRSRNLSIGVFQVRIP